MKHLLFSDSEINIGRQIGGDMAKMFAIFFMPISNTTGMTRQFRELRVRNWSSYGITRNTMSPVRKSPDELNNPQVHQG